MKAWLLPSFGFIVFSGAVGVTAKIALRTISWRELVILSVIAYVVIAALITLVWGWEVSLSSGAAIGILSGLFASLSLVSLMIALEEGEVSRVVPLTSTYPVVTLLLSIVILSEGVSIARLVGTVLVVCGVIALTR